MKINTNYEAEFCGRVPLNQTNLIQPHGILLVVEKSELRIIQASENVDQAVGKDVKSVVGTSLQTILSADETARLVNQFQKPVTDKLPFTLTLPGGNYLALVQSWEKHFIFELERISEQTPDTFLKVYQELKYAMNAVERAGNLEDTCQAAAEELKKISGFDKIMIYKFDPDWNGDVIAEVKEEGMDSYLGLKFPASDIPKQARELYRTTPYRLIPSVNYEPVKLYPVINLVTNAFTDLSATNLRSVAAVHIEYLKNMGVVASMSTRILVNGKLWGLISCHHREAKYLSFDLCAIFELLSNIISAKIAAMEQHDAYEYRSRMQGIFTQLLEEVYRDGDLSQSFLHNQDDFMKLLNADGVAYIWNKQIYAFGKTPAATDIADLVLWLQSGSVNRLYHNPSLSTAFEPAGGYADTASGILALPIHPEKGSYIIAFRAEAVQKVNWGGNPNEAVQFEADGKKYHPRASFNLWQQTVAHTSIPWKEEEMAIAESFRNFVVEYTLQKYYN